jgi:hypothetical protein
MISKAGTVLNSSDAKLVAAGAPNQAFSGQFLLLGAT